MGVHLSKMDVVSYADAVTDIQAVTAKRVKLQLIFKRHFKRTVIRHDNFCQLSLYLQLY